MILDTLENSGKYESIHPKFSKAFEYLKSTDLNALPYGKVELEGNDLVVIVAEMTGKTADETRMETHKKYIDIQVPIGKTEVMGWIAGSKLSNIAEVYNEEKDIAFFADKASNMISVQPYEFAIFFPEDGHQPGISDGVYKKIIVKILVG